MKRSPIRKFRSKPRAGRVKGKAMKALRDACLKRDKNRCCECSTWVTDDVPDMGDRKYHMAHIKAKRIGGDTLNNVRTLCGRCHRDEHFATVNGKFQHEKVRLHA